jgi:hypothetical protein
MSRRGDRLTVPTNGHHPPLVGDIAESTPAVPSGAETPAVGVDQAPSRPGVLGSLAPGHVIAAIGAIVSLALLVAERRRRVAGRARRDR